MIQEIQRLLKWGYLLIIFLLRSRWSSALFEFLYPFIKETCSNSRTWDFSLFFTKTNMYGCLQEFIFAVAATSPSWVWWFFSVSQVRGIRKYKMFEIICCKKCWILSFFPFSPDWPLSCPCYQLWIKPVNWLTLQSLCQKKKTGIDSATLYVDCKY